MMRRNRHKLGLISVIFSAAIANPVLVSAGTTSSSSQNGTSQGVTTNTTSGFQVNATATSTSGMSANSAANLQLMQGTAINMRVESPLQANFNSSLVNDSNGGFTQTGQGSVTGIGASNNVVIDATSSTFSTNVGNKSTQSNNPQDTGTGSAGFSTSLSSTITQDNTSFTSTLNQSFGQ